MRSIKVEGLDIPWTALTLGCLQLAPSEAWGDACTAEEADRVVKTALDGGILAFDTSEGFGDGESERRLGKALGSRKNEVNIVSKIWPDAKMTVEGYQSRLDGTLKALGRDYVDAYLVHWPGMYIDSMVNTGKMCDVMAALKETGKARTVFDTISDNAANAGIVLGKEKHAIDAMDLRWVGALTFRNDEIEETGLGAGVLNDPVESVVWLCRRMAQYGQSIEPGQVILSGSFIRPVECPPDTRIHADFGAFG